MKLAIPRFGETVAPCFEYSATITIIEFDRRQEVERTDFTLKTRVAHDRIRLLRDQAVDTLICGGVQQQFEDMIKTHGIQVISGVEGTVEEIVAIFLQGRLKPGTEVRANREPDHRD